MNDLVGGPTNDLAQWLDARLDTRQRNRILQRFPQKSGLIPVNSTAEQHELLETLRDMLSGQAPNGRRAILYIAPHPYCMASHHHEACGFCTFPHEPFAHGKDVSEAVRHVQAEAKFYVDVLENCPVDAVYFGGGTANLLTAEKGLGEFMQSIRTFNLQEGAEVTFEGMPSLFKRSTLETFSEVMSDLDLRISVGVQTFNKEILNKYMGRIWQKEDSIKECIDIAKGLGIRVSLDLIFNLPSQSLQHLEYDVDRVAEMEPEHLTFFDLVVGEGVDSAWSRSPEIMSRLVSPAECYERWERLGEMLDARGYERLSKSDFAHRPAGERARYVYEALWKRPDTHTMLGLGYEGMSTVFEPNLDGGLKVVNHRDPVAYAESVDQGVPPAAGLFYYDRTDVLLYELSSQLETGSIHRERVRSVYMEDVFTTFGLEIELLLERGLAIQNERELQLTPRGVFYVDTVQALFCHSRVEELKGGSPGPAVAKPVDSR